MYKVVLKNIRGIKEMVFPFPEKKGIYVLTGANGCGKTSLLVSLCRLGDRFAYKHFYVNSHDNIKFDSYKNAAITYSDGTNEVTYERKRNRWEPMPRGQKDLISKFPFRNTLFISTSGLRFFHKISWNQKGLGSMM